MPALSNNRVGSTNRNLHHNQQAQLPFILPKSVPLFDRAKLFLAAGPAVGVVSSADHPCSSSSRGGGSSDDGYSTSTPTSDNNTKTDKQQVNKKPRKKRVPPYARMPCGKTAATTGGSSGYSADLEPTSVDSLPCYIDLLKGKHSASTVLVPNKDNKRSKLNPEELQYLAHTAKRGEKLSQSPSRPRMLFPPRSGVDVLNTVSLLHSLEYDSNDGVAAASGNYSAEHVAALDGLMASVLPGVLRDTAPIYDNSLNEQPLPQALLDVLATLPSACDLLLKDETNNSIAGGENSSIDDSESTTSSFTVSDEGTGLQEGGGRSPSAADVAVELSTMASSSVRSSRENNMDAEKNKSSVITIGEALSITNTPRILTTASAPFHIVQVNAAFYRLLDASQSGLLGQPASALTASTDGALQGALQESAVSAKPVEIDNQVFGIINKHQQKHRVLVTPVGPSSDIVTHFAIETIGTDTDFCPVHFEPQHNNHAPMNVMG